MHRLDGIYLRFSFKVMEMDSDIDGDLARVLSCMGTDDKEVIITHLL